MLVPVCPLGPHRTWEDEQPSLEKVVKEERREQQWGERPRMVVYLPWGPRGHAGEGWWDIPGVVGDEVSGRTV